MFKSPFSTEEECALGEDTIVRLRQPGTFSEGRLTNVLRLAHGVYWHKRLRWR